MKLFSPNPPVVVNITNYLAMNFNANALLAIGASPIMSFYHKEMDDLLAIASSLVINIGCLDDNEIAGMHAAAAAAQKYGKPWVLDPVVSGQLFLKPMDTVCQVGWIGNLAVIDFHLVARHVVVHH